MAIKEPFKKWISVLLRPFRGMDWDSDPKYVNEGRVLDALNTRPTSQGDRTNTTRQSIEGNEFAFTTEIPRVQNKKFRITITSDAGEAKNYSFKIKDANGVLIAETDNVYVPAGVLGSTTLTQVSNSFTTALGGYSHIVTAGSIVSNYERYFDITITAVPGWEYTIEQEEWGKELLDNTGFDGATGWTVSSPSQWSLYNSIGNPTGCEFTSANTIIRTVGDFIADGFEIGGEVEITLATINPATNNGTFKIIDLTATTITVEASANWTTGLDGTASLAATGIANFTPIASPTPGFDQYEIEQNPTVYSNIDYKTDIEVGRVDAGFAKIFIGGSTLTPNLQGTISEAGEFSFIGRRGSGFYNGFIVRASDVDDGDPTTFEGWIDNISLKPQNDAATIQVIQEAIDNSISGALRPIGSYDLLGDLYIAWSNVEDLQGTFDVEVIDDSGVLNPLTGFNYIQVTTTADHGLADFEYVAAQGAPNATNANGKWIVMVTGPRDFYLLDSNFSVAATTGTVLTKIRTLSEIGVAQKNKTTEIWTYTRLVRSNKLGMRIPWLVDMHVERDAYKDSIYWVDHNNVDRVLYNRGEFLQDGLINFFNPNNSYFYETIAQESQLLLSQSGVRLNFERQLQTGGNIPAGNHKYTISLLTDSLVSTEFIPPIGPIPAYDQRTDGAPRDIFGSVPDDLSTPKVNEFKVTGIPANVYKFIELVDLWYNNDTGIPTPIVVKREPIPANATEITIQHTGYENDVRDITIAELNQRQTPYIVSKNIDVLDNKMIRSNLKTAASIDFSDFFKTFRHSIEKKTVSDIGRYEGGGSFQLGGYQDPENVAYYGALMPFECYRFYGRVELIDGSFTDSFWIDDIRIDTLPNNIDPAYPDDRRDSGSFTNYDHVDTSAGGGILVPYVDFHGFDLDYAIDGIRVRDLAKSIHIEMVEMDDSNREVLASGIGIMGWEGYQAANPNFIFSLGPGSIGEWGFVPNTWTPDNTFVTQFPHVAGSRMVGFSFNGVPSGDFAGDNPTYGPHATGANSAQRRDWMFFYSPDIMFGGKTIERQVGDVVISLGSPDKSAFFPNRATGLTNGWFGDVGTLFSSEYTEYYGDTGRSGDLYSGQAVSHVSFLSDGEAAEIDGDRVRNNILAAGDPSGLSSITVADYAEMINHSCIAIKFNTTLSDGNLSGNTDYGAYVSYYYRPRSSYGANYNPDTSKFGQRTSGNTAPINSIFEISNGLPSVVQQGDFPVFGKDVFLAKTYVKLRNWSNVQYPNNSTSLGLGAGIAFYSFSEVNPLLINKDDPDTEERYGYPHIDLADWLRYGGLVGQSPLYNRGYKYANGVNFTPAYDPNVDQAAEFKALITYSDTKLDGSLIDEYRISRPLNIKYLDLSNGPIMEHIVINGELFTLQERSFEKQAFNSRSTISTEEGSEVIIGDGAAFNPRGQQISKIGTRHKWSVIKGNSPGGSDTLYWVNAELGAFVRFGYDGTVQIGMIKGMDAFLQARLTHVDRKDQPTTGQGIAAVWNDRHKEAIWTVRGLADWEEWSVTKFLANIIEDGSFTNVIDNGFGKEVLVDIPVGGLSYGSGQSTQRLFGTQAGINYTFEGLFTDSFGQSPIPGFALLPINQSDVAALSGLPGLGVRITFDVKGINATFGNASDIGVYFRLGSNPISATTWGTVGDKLTVDILGPIVTSNQLIVIWPTFRADPAGTTNNIGAITPTFAAPNIITRGAGDFTADGFLVDGRVTVINSALGNNGTYKITAVSPLQIDVVRSSNSTGGGTNPAFTPGADGTAELIVDNRIAQGSIYIDNVVVEPFYDQIYSAGDIVAEPGLGSDVFEDTPNFYISTQDNNYNNDPTAAESLFWTKIDRNDPRVYNEYTIVYSEKTNDFVYFKSPKPKLWMRWEKGFLSPRPVGDQSKVYEHDRGTYLEWYRDGDDVQAEDGYVDMAFNYMPEDNKTFGGVQMTTEITPYRVEFRTNTHQSYLDAADFENRDGKYVAGLREDSTGSGLNDNDTSLLFGDYISVKLIFQTGIFQKLFSAIQRMLVRPRDYMK